MASIGSFVPKNLLKVLSSDPHRIPSIVIRCASTSLAPTKPPVKTNTPQTNAATDSTDEKMDTNYIGGSLFTNYI
ncbi:unnamed protein product [Coffea canephora]|uniref:DH200=94 genomic scaffold, scaffold_188 n=1 Tax=Coffea canephora TaxID=49390 RepID=A0A068VBE9_COFCA|nr:unnamed protein product [Coffea canephora]